MSNMEIAPVVLVALYVLLVGPVLAVLLYATRRASPDAIEEAAKDVQHFIDLRERARTELAETGSYADFIATKAEARKHLWRPSSERARPASTTVADRPQQPSVPQDRLRRRAEPQRSRYAH